MLNKAYQLVQRKGSRLREPYHGEATSRHRSGELRRSLTAGQPVNRYYTSHILKCNYCVLILIFHGYSAYI